MANALPFLLGGAMLVTLLVLLVGVVTFAFDSSLNAKYATRLMTARVVCQGIALALFALVIVTQID